MGVRLFLIRYVKQLRVDPPVILRRPIEQGPVSVLINSPEMAKRASDLSSYLHQESILWAKIQELAMLVTAREGIADSSGTTMPPPGTGSA